MNLWKYKPLFVLMLVGILGAGAFIALSHYKTENSNLPIYGKIPPFNLINLDGAIMSLEKLNGKVWVADFIFTSCPGPCPLMTSKMRNLQEVFQGDHRVKFVSISIDPKTDTPDTLKQYAKKFSADTKQWFFLTGRRDEIVSLAQNGFKVATGDESDPNLHTTKFILVDQVGQIRGYYDSQEANFLTVVTQSVKDLL